jgi:hypothetical protein
MAKTLKPVIAVKKDKNPPFQEPTPKRWATRKKQVNVVSAREG